MVSPINYHIEGENVIIENELNVFNQLSQFAHSVHTLLSSFGSNIYIGNEENRTNIIRLINADRNAALIEPRGNDEVNSNWNLQLLYEQRYIIRANEVNLFSFNNQNNAREVFRLLTNSIVRIVNSIRRQ